MAYLVTNTTDVSGIVSPTPDGYYTGQILYVADIPNVATLKWNPGQTIDLDQIASRVQIEKSRHLRVHDNKVECLLL